MAQRHRVLGLCLVALLALPLSQASAHSNEAAPAGEEDQALGFDEHLGAYIPLDLSFTGEDGKAVKLADLVQRPTFLILAFYDCKNECNTLLVGAAKALRDLEAKPGLDYQVVTVSINPDEGPADALAKKRIALASIEKPYPPEAWRFLVGSHDAIDALADSVGFNYRKVKDEYDHPLGLVVLSPKGQVVRYIYGQDFLPVDLSMSVLEASAGIVRPTVARMLRFCMSYDPASRRFSFDFLRVGGVIISIIVTIFLLFLVFRGRKPRSKKGEGSPR